MLKIVRYDNIYTKKGAKPVKVRVKLYVKHLTSLLFFFWLLLASGQIRRGKIRIWPSKRWTVL